MSRTTRWLAAIISVQAALVGVYWLVQRARNRELRVGSQLATDPPQRVDMVFPAIAVRRRDGTTTRLPIPTRPTLVHVWATWCPPCRAELPGVLRLSGQYGVDVVAIALDNSWGEVERFLHGQDAARVVLASRSLEQALGVRSLPVTFMVRDGGRIVLRFDGARDWTDETFVEASIGDAVDER
jgi:thiol-disulfide isomerase/thioredoxin